MRVTTYGLGGYRGTKNPNIVSDVDDGKTPEKDDVTEIKERLAALESKSVRA